MMYCEFIDISEYGENYITFTEYHDYIEPIYMECDMSKQDFVALLKENMHQKSSHRTITITVIAYQKLLVIYVS